jgi:hypothetical protein
MARHRRAEKGKAGGEERTVLLTRPLVLSGEDSDLWMKKRKALLAELRSHGLPTELFKALDSFGYGLSVRWLNERGEKPEIGDRVFPVVEPRQKKFKPTAADVRQYEKAVALFQAAHAISPMPSHVGEATAYWLLKQLSALRGGQYAPVRTQNKLARSSIAAAAMMLLESLVPDGAFLVDLIRELLEVKLPGQAETKEFQARKAAIQIWAQIPDIGVRRLARSVGVNPSTISRWQRDPEFVKELEDCRRWISDPLVAKALTSEKAMHKRSPDREKDG